MHSPFRLAEIPSWFRATPVYRDMIANEEQRTQATRLALAERITAAHERRDRALPALQRAATKARHQYEEARAAMEAKERALQAAEVAVYTLQHSISYEQAKCEAELRRTADPRLAEFRTELVNLHQHVRCEGTPAFRMRGENHWLTQEPDDTPLKPHREAVLAQLDAIAAAIEATEALQLEPVVDVDARLGELRQAVVASAGLGVRLELALAEPASAQPAA